ncbi:type II secretion system F family protein [Paenibacillus sp. y28]|uniref:type II secretion system F family protein n=1 Tax=Paenibacillus sp. y28 TaxID=3129110 RepID=UPI0030180FE3
MGAGVQAGVMIPALLLLLFFLLYTAIHRGLSLFFAQTAERSRLHYVQRSRLSQRFAGVMLRSPRLSRHLTDLLESGSSSYGLRTFVMLTAMLLLAGILFGSLLFYSVKGVVVLSVILASLPYLLLRLRLLGLQLQTRLDFLPAVEVFYQYYVLTGTGTKNIRTALQVSLAEHRIMNPVRPVFEQLQRHLATGRELDDALRLFSLSFGHVWAEYFINIIRVGLQEGNDITASLKDLIYDMRRARRSDQAQRNRLLEIRIANFTPIGFLILFIAVNFRVNAQTAYMFYFVDPVGRSMLLDACFLIFASFLMGVYLSMRRM